MKRTRGSADEPEETTIMRIFIALALAACLSAAAPHAWAGKGRGTRQDCDASCATTMGLCTQCCYRTFMADPEFARCFRGETNCRASCDPYQPSRCDKHCTRLWVDECQDKVVLDYDCH